MSEDHECISVVFALIAELAAALGVREIGTTFPACWELDVDPHWHLSINGHEDEQKNHTGVPVPPFHCYAEFNGWPAGLFTPFGGVVAAGTVANEAALIRALRVKLLASA
jgi:hypothetical protein